MAAQHAAYWETPRFTGDLQPLTVRSATSDLLGDLVRRRFIGNMKGQAADIVPESMKRQGRILFECSADIDAFWASQPQTVIHGDTHLGNLFFEGDSPGFIDWQVTRAGVGMRDVADFATGSVEPELLARSNATWSSATPRATTRPGFPVDVDQLWTIYRVGATESTRRSSPRPRPASGRRTRRSAVWASTRRRGDRGARLAHRAGDTRRRPP